MEFVKYLLRDVCSRLSSGKNIKASEVLSEGPYPVFGGNGLRGYAKTSNFIGSCAIIGRQGAYCGNVRYFKGEAHMTEHAVVVQGNELADNYYLSALLSTMHLERLSGQSAQPGLAVGTLAQQEIELPSIEDQRRIANILSSLDRKIELNNKLNAQLEEMAQTLFKHWFVDFGPFKDGKFVESELGMIPEGWRVGTLTEIASYMNGLAMQKFPAEIIEESLPVLKIKELGQGYTDQNSDRCSTSIKPEYIIKDGDIIFSWSGTLLVDIWCGGRCGLNQHLFKVSSADYPKWFYYYWTKQHLDKFIRIAKDKAVTMGHIKRGELDKSLVLIPDCETLQSMTSKMEPILNLIVSNNLSNRDLVELRDTLLPKLMSGEMKL